MTRTRTRTSLHAHAPFSRTGLLARPTYPDPYLKWVNPCICIWFCICVCIWFWVCVFVCVLLENRSASTVHLPWSVSPVWVKPCLLTLPAPTIERRSPKHGLVHISVKCTGHDPGRGSTRDKSSKYFHPEKHSFLLPREEWPFAPFSLSWRSLILLLPCQWEWSYVKSCHRRHTRFFDGGRERDNLGIWRFVFVYLWYHLRCCAPASSNQTDQVHKDMYHLMNCICMSVYLCICVFVLSFEVYQLTNQVH